MGVTQSMVFVDKSRLEQELSDLKKEVNFDLSFNKFS